MPFVAPATFQRLMDAGLDCCAAYLDDLIVYSGTWKEHLVHLEQVFSRLKQAGLTVKANKCQIGMQECVYLGHVVGKGQVRPEPSKLEAVVAFPVPKTKKDVRAFLELSGYYRRFIPNYSSVAAPLSDLTKKALPKQERHLSKCVYLVERMFVQEADFEQSRFYSNVRTANRCIGLRRAESNR